MARVEVRIAGAPTTLLEDGISPHLVRDRLGHSNVSITLRVYAGVTPKMRSDVAARAAAAIDG